MVTVARKTSFPAVFPRKPHLSDSSVEDFIARARVLGVEAGPLMVSKPARVFPWIRRNEDFLHVSWPIRKSLSFFGLWEVSWTRWGSGTFRKHQASRVIMPLEGERAAHALRELPEIEEMAVLEERRIDPILAVRVAGQWYKAYRWWQPPRVIQDDGP